MRLSRCAARRLLLFLSALVLPLLLTLFALPPRQVAAEQGDATWYGIPFHGRFMANGQRYDMNDPTTTASNQFPMGTWLLVTNLANGRSVTVQVRDRGGFGHALDLSYAAFAALDDPLKMRIHVSYEAVAGPARQAPAAPAQAPVATPPPSPAPAVKPTPAVKPETPGEHIVAAGETLFGIARRFGVALADLVRVNNITDPDQVPIGQRLVFGPAASQDQRSTPEQGVSARSNVSAAADPEALSHTVQPGETLSDIATAHSLTAAELVQLNNLGDPDALTIGQQLRLSERSAPLAPRPAAAPQNRSTGQTTEYTVQVGETLWDIAAKLETTPDVLVRLNGLGSPDLLTVGQTLRLADTTDDAVAATASAVPPVSSRPYVVQEGDSLSSIATRFDTTATRLLAMNNLSDPDALQPGQVIALP